MLLLLLSPFVPGQAITNVYQHFLSLAQATENQQFISLELAREYQNFLSPEPKFYKFLELVVERALCE
jgi:hypothetical protein